MAGAESATPRSSTRGDRGVADSAPATPESERISGFVNQRNRPGFIAPAGSRACMTTAGQAPSRGGAAPDVQRGLQVGRAAGEDQAAVGGGGEVAEAVQDRRPRLGRGRRRGAMPRTIPLPAWHWIDQRPGSIAATKPGDARGPEVGLERQRRVGCGLAVDERSPERIGVDIATTGRSSRSGSSWPSRSSCQETASAVPSKPTARTQSPAGRSRPERPRRRRGRPGR